MAGTVLGVDPATVPAIGVYRLGKQGDLQPAIGARADPEQEPDGGAGRAKRDESVEPALLPERAGNIAVMQLFRDPDPEHVEKETASRKLKTMAKSWIADMRVHAPMTASPIRPRGLWGPA